METLARAGFTVEVITGPRLDVGPDFDVGRWASQRTFVAEPAGRITLIRSDGLRAEVPAHARLQVRGVTVCVHGWPPGPRTEPATDEELAEFLRLVEMMIDRTRPDVIVVPGDDRLAREIFGRGHARGIATVRILDDLNHRETAPAELVDATIAPSQFAADYYLEAFGAPCTVLPPLVDFHRVLAERAGPGYVTFVDPTPARGVWAFARIAEQLGLSRPDIPLLVVEGRGKEEDLTACGLDLRASGNLNVMSPARDPRDYLRLARVVVVPALGWDGPPGAELEAIANGISVVATDRGGLPERVGDAGVLLSLPERITPATRTVPTAEEVGPWVEAIIRLWDDAESVGEPRAHALSRAGGEAHDALAERYRRFFAELRPATRATPARPLRRQKGVVLVPHLHGIDWECEQALRCLEDGGVKIVRRGGSSAIDAARNELASNALHEGFESILFIDSDIGFDASDAFRLLARPEPVLCGIYAKKGVRGFASNFAEDVDDVLFGPDAQGPYPVDYAATGFLRIKTDVLRRMIAALELPLCNTKWGQGLWPFFMPMVVPHDGDKLHYLGEDWSFSHRLRQIGVTPMADTSIRLAHWGRYGYGWEDTSADVKRFRSFRYHFQSR